MNITVNFRASRFIHGTCPNRASNASFGQVVLGEHLPEGQVLKKKYFEPCSECMYFVNSYFFFSNVNGPAESTMHTPCISSHGNVYTFADTITDATLGCFQNFAINMLNACWCLLPILVVINTNNN